MAFADEPDGGFEGLVGGTFVGAEGEVAHKERMFGAARDSATVVEHFLGLGMSVWGACMNEDGDDHEEAYVKGDLICGVVP